MAVPSAVPVLFKVLELAPRPVPWRHRYPSSARAAAPPTRRDQMKQKVEFKEFIIGIEPNTGSSFWDRTSPQCCNSVVPSTNAAATAVAALLGLDLSGLSVPIGLSCSPITVGNNCGSTTVTCDAPDKEWGGLIAINCLPITA
ncbi:hypothetical protein C8F04DRAFT_1269739 [Mycena alexandri]|uniref:Hydrophobin n=1 Tax=Mycena alexandri TaxID=1745969 RepID=A0AAD6SDH4_9AGAR|nr:hypothetical protein C8F04DRAFT_1269739 [Mycena alexandri]